MDNYLLNIPKINYEFDSVVNKRKSHIEDKIMQLEQEKRQEDIKYWEQIKELQKDLLIAFNEYWLSWRKKEFLDISENEK